MIFGCLIDVGVSLDATFLTSNRPALTSAQAIRLQTRRWRGAFVSPYTLIDGG
jgi:hypothetical protein